MKRPYWMCFRWRNWRNIWCVLDIIFHCKARWVCGKHDAAITAKSDLPPDYMLTQEQFDRAYEKGMAVADSGSPWVQIPATTTTCNGTTSATFVWTPANWSATS